MDTIRPFQLEPCDPGIVDELRGRLGCTQTLAWVLARRGVSVEQAQRLMVDDPELLLSEFHDPFLLGDMAAAVERIRFAVAESEPIVIHGDYDADGVCATTLLVEALESLDANVHAFLPDRFSNGYGLQVNQLEQFARDGMKLLIAVDCGITAVEPIAHARELGLETIICDHHVPSEILPDAIICSTRPSNYPFPHLCATAVVGKLAQALGVQSGPSQHELEAIATVADCVPLVEENRAIVKRGLRALQNTKRPGLRALIEGSGVRCPDINSESVGFKIAPRINATGRIDHSEKAYELLRADESSANALAAAVIDTNENRRKIEQNITQQAIDQIEQWDADERRSRIYVAAGEGWHEGVIGIVAARLVERYSRPVVVITSGAVAKGSARSIDGVNLHTALAACDDLLIRWGGHAQAGGLSLDPAKIAEFRARLTLWGDQNISEEKLTLVDRIDAIVPSSELTFELVSELERLSPYGAGWEHPSLVLLDGALEQPQAVGADGTHLRAQVRSGAHTTSAIGFGLAHKIADMNGELVDLAVVPSINRFRGAESLQVRIERIYERPQGADHADSEWCTTCCMHGAEGRVGAAEIIKDATGLANPSIVDSGAFSLPSTEKLLNHPNASDLRKRVLASDYVAQLVGAACDMVIVVADVPRRRPVLAPLFSQGRLGDSLLTVISERLNYSYIQGLVDTHFSEELKDGQGRVLIVDQHSLGIVAQSCRSMERVVVYDPPLTKGIVDQLAALSCSSLDLIFGEREEQFALDALKELLDVRGNLASAFRSLRDHGPAHENELMDLLWGDNDQIPRSKNAIVYGLRTLLERNLIEPDGSNGLRLVGRKLTSASRSA